MTAAVVVLGDLGRSPRMQYHCLSLASMPAKSVEFVGYAGEQCTPALEAATNIRKRFVSNPFTTLSRKWFLLYAPVKVLIQVSSIPAHNQVVH